MFIMLLLRLGVLMLVEGKGRYSPEVSDVAGHQRQVAANRACRNQHVHVLSVWLWPAALLGSWQTASCLLSGAVAAPKWINQGRTYSETD